jgi:hypothetical protein
MVVPELFPQATPKSLRSLKAGPPAEPRCSAGSHTANQVHPRRSVAREASFRFTSANQAGLVTPTTNLLPTW